MEPNMRRVVLAAFDKEWENAVNTMADLERCLNRLSDQMTQLAEAGAFMHLQFDATLHQEWWISFQEAQGQLIPRHPLEVPMIPMTSEL